MSIETANNLLTISEAALMLGVSVKTLRRWEKQGKLGATKTMGGHRRYDIENLKRAKSIKYKHAESVPETTTEIVNKWPLGKKKFLGRTFLFAGVLALVLGGVKGAGEYRKALGKSWMASGYDGSGVVLAESISLGNTAFNVRVPTNVSESLTVDGVVTIGSGLGVTGDTTMDGSLNVTGAVTVGDLGTGIVTATGGLLTLSTGIDTTLLTDGSLLEVDLSSTNDATDNYVLSFDLGTGGFTWVAQTTDTDTVNPNYWSDGGAWAYLTSSTDYLRLGSVSAASALLHVGSGTPVSIDGANDAYITDDLEVGGTIYGNISGTISPGFTQGSVVFADASGNLAEDNSNFFWDDTNNRLGIGTSAPGSKLSVRDTTSSEQRRVSIVSARDDDDTSTTYYDLSVEQSLSGSTAKSSSDYGIYANINSEITGTMPNMNIYPLASLAAHVGTGSIGSISGINATASVSAGQTARGYGGLFQFQNNGWVTDSTVTTGYGLYSTLYNTTLGTGYDATITTAYGVKSRVNNAAFLSGELATMTNAYGVFSEVGSEYFSGTSTITNAYNVYLNNYDKTSGSFSYGTVTNNYGLYIETPTRGSTVNYSIYSEGGNNYFGGNVGIGTTQNGYHNSAYTNGLAVEGKVGIGTTAPQAKLQINGSSDVTQFILRANATQTITNPLISLQNSSGTTLMEINTNAASNVFIGVDAGYSTTTGVDNTFIGDRAGYSNTEGVFNTFVGNQAGYATSTGEYNNFFGGEAGKDNTTGSSNNFFGESAGVSNNIGTENSFFGDITGRRNTSGNYNSYFGSTAGSSNSTGSYNSIFGAAAGYGVSSNSYSNNSLFGYKTGYSLTTGSNNIFLGYQAGETATTATKNIVIGYDIDLPATNSSNMLNIGNLIYATGLDGTGTTLSSGNVGIGVTSPTETLHVAGNVLGTGHGAFGSEAAVDDISLYWGGGYSVSNTLTLEETVTSATLDQLSGITNYLNLNPSADTASYIYGIDNTWFTQSGNTRNFTGPMRGISNVFQHFGSGTVSSVSGIMSQIIKSAGTITSATAYSADCNDAATCYGLYVGAGDAEVTNDWGVYVTGEDYDYFSGNVGIGTSTPGAAKLNVQATETVGTNATVSLATTFTPTTSDSNTNRNLYSSIVSTNSTNTASRTTEASLIYNRHDGTGSMGTVRALKTNAVLGATAGAVTTLEGIYNHVNDQGASNTTTARGLNNLVSMLAFGTTRTTTTGYGVQNKLAAQAVAGTANMTTAYGIYSEVGAEYNTAFGTAANISNAYNLYLNNFDLTGGYSAGTITNNYGMYIETPTRGSTLNYSIYSEGGDNYFGGAVGIGTSAPGTKLAVAGGVGIGTTDSFANAAIAANNLAVQGRVGVGITNPSYGLQVSSSLSTGIGANNIAPSGSATIYGLFSRPYTSVMGTGFTDKLAGVYSQPAYQAATGGGSVYSYYAQLGGYWTSGPSYYPGKYTAYYSNDITSFDSDNYPLYYAEFGTDFVIKGDGSTGIGTSSPGTKLGIAGGVGIGTTAAGGFANAAVEASNLGVEGKLGVGTTAFSTATFSSAKVIIKNGTSVGVTQGDVLGLGVATNSNATHSSIFAVPYGNGAGINLTAVVGSPITLGPADSLISYYSHPNAVMTGGAVTNMYGFKNHIESSYNTVTNAYGFYTDNPDSSFSGGSLTNNYGLYIADQTAGSVDYGIYVAGADTAAAYFGDNVGIGVTAPAAKLDVVGSALFGAGSEVQITRSGEIGYVRATSGHSLQLSADASVFPAIFIGTSTNVGVGTSLPGTRLSVVGGVGIGTTASGGFANAAILDNNLAVQGSVGIGVTSPTMKLDVRRSDDGSVAYFADDDNSCTLDPDGDLTCTSDLRLKKDVSSLDEGEALSTVNSLRAVRYSSLNEDDGSLQHFGFIAQEVETVAPELVMTNEEGYMALAYSRFTPLLTAAIQELSAQIEELKIQETDISAAATDITAEKITTTDLTVLGNTLLAETTIVGGLNIGLIQIDPTQNSIDAVGTLSIQPLALGDIEFVGGLVKIDTEGKVLAAEVETGKLTVSEETTGKAIIPAGETEVEIITTAVTETSKVFTSPRTRTGNQALIIGEIRDDDGFKVVIEEAQSEDIEFDWWIIETTSN